MRHSQRGEDDVAEPGSCSELLLTHLHFPQVPVSLRSA
jgi:hypothetical protein